MRTPDDLASAIRQRRREMDLTQAALAKRAHVSLATIQNVEAGRANPALSTITQILGPLGLHVEVDSRPADWDLLADLGVPLTSSVASSRERTRADLRVHVRRAALEVAAARAPRDEARKREALQAYLLALHTHYPTRFEEWFDGCREVEDLLPSPPSGRVIKLMRVAKDRLAELL